MGKLTFKGGIHPYEGKELSKNSPIEKYLPKGEMVYPLSQHIGAPSVPCVNKGDRVLAGQKIAEANGFVSVPLHASVSGTVKGFEKRLTAAGSMADSIIIENDQQYEETAFQAAELSELSKEEIIARIREGGVVGMGGAGFPTHVKLSPKEPDKIEYVLVNGAECEPYLTSDYRRMLEEPDKIVAGLEVMLKLFDHAKGYICIEDNKPDCIAKLRELVKGHSRIEVKEVMTKYPQGGERTLIYATTGREINSSMLPADAGCVVDNVDTVVAVYKAVILGRPVMNRIVTVTGDAIASPKNFTVLTGTNMEELIEAAGGLKTGAAKVISGGPMMGFAMFDLHVPCVKTTSAFLCLEKDAVSEAMREWTSRMSDTHYCLGSVMGPHPFPVIVRDFQSVISREIKEQMIQKEGRLPDAVVAGVGGGSNAIGSFYHFIEDKQVRLIGCEAAGRGIDTAETAATIATGKPGIFHGMKSYFCQDQYGQIAPVYSISAGLDYPGVGPEHSYLHDIGRAEYVPVTDEEAVGAFEYLARAEGIIPAIESAHAVAYGMKIAPAMETDKIVVITISGRGDKDCASIARYRGENIYE